MFPNLDQNTLMVRKFVWPHLWLLNWVGLCLMLNLRLRGSLAPSKNSKREEKSATPPPLSLILSTLKGILDMLKQLPLYSF